MDWNLNVGHLITAGTIIFAAGGVYYVSRENARRMREDITDIKTDLKALNKVVMDVAVQNTRLDGQAERITQMEKRQDERLAAMERRWEEVRRGDGLIVKPREA